MTDTVQRLREEIAEKEREAKAIEAARVQAAEGQPPAAAGVAAAPAAPDPAAEAAAPAQAPGILTPEQIAAYEQQPPPRSYREELERLKQLEQVEDSIRHHQGQR